MELKTWLTYLITEFVVSVIPGPAVLFVTTRGLRHGAAESYFAALGISSGTVVYFILSALGLGAIILKVNYLFEFIKLAGALFLLWMGIQMILKSFGTKKAATPERQVSKGKGKAYLWGLVVELSNPKAIIFFLALVPQFINLKQAIFPQFLILCLTTIILETLILMAYGWLAATGGKRSAENQKLVQWYERISGGAIIGIALNLLFMKNDK